MKLLIDQKLNKLKSVVCTYLRTGNTSTQPWRYKKLIDRNQLKMNTNDKLLKAKNMVKRDNKTTSVPCVCHYV